MTDLNLKDVLVLALARRISVLHIAPMNNLCITCEKKLRKDSSHSPYCSRCWLKFTPEGKAFNTAKTKSFYIPRTNLKPQCLACNKPVNTLKNQGYCRRCWEEWTEEGREYRCEKVRKAQAKGKNKKTLN